MTSGLALAPAQTNGSVDAALSATGDDSATGRSNIVAAEYTIDGAPAVAMSVGAPAPVAGLHATIPTTTLAEGTHVVAVRSEDAALNWGATSTIVLVVDKTAPAVSSISAAPNPTVGAASVTLLASATDAGSGVTAAEWFTGADPGAGNAAAMTPTGTGPWTLGATVTVSTWANGSYTLSVRARDAAGNWSSLGSTVLVVSASSPPPALLYFSTLGNTAVPGVGGTADDADIYATNGTTYTREIDASGTGSLGLPSGANVDGFVRVDATHFYASFSATNTSVPGLGNVQDEDVVYYNNGVWSVYFDGTAHGLTANNQEIDAFSIVGGTLYFSTFGNTNPPGVTGTADDADIYSWNGSTYSRVWDATASGLPGTANVDGLKLVDATHFFLSFSSTTTTVPGLGAVPDVNVVYDSAGTWSTYFAGAAHGLVAGTGQDVDAIDIP